MSNWKYGKKSGSRLDTCHPLLQDVAYRALELSPVDITIIWGWRGEEIQNAFFESGASSKRFPDSKHNALLDDQITPCSEALDFGPWVNGDIPWNDTNIFCVVAGAFFAAAAELGVTIRWGGDWDMDGSTTDQKLMDFGHIEIML